MSFVITDTCKDERKLNIIEHSRCNIDLPDIDFGYCPRSWQKFNALRLDFWHIIRAREFLEETEWAILAGLNLRNENFPQNSATKKSFSNQSKNVIAGGKIVSKKCFDIFWKISRIKTTYLYHARLYVCNHFYYSFILLRYCIAHKINMNSLCRCKS